MVKAESLEIPSFELEVSQFGVVSSLALLVTLFDRLE
jgi:hypothetical protein